MGDAAPTSVTVRDRRARIAASGAFAVQGVCFAAVFSQVPTLRDKFGLDETQLTLVLAAVPIVAGVGSVLAGALTPRIGSGPVLRDRRAGRVPSPWRPSGSLPRWRILYAAVAVFGLVVGGGRRDHEHAGRRGPAPVRPQHPPSCHAWWSVAGIGSRPGRDRGRATSGCPLAGLPRRPWPSSGRDHRSVDRPRAAQAERGDRRPAGRAAPRPATGSRGGPVVLVGLAVMVMFIGDSATTSWSGIFLTRRARVPPAGRAAGSLRLPDLPVARPYGGGPGHRAGSARWPR